MKIVFCSHRGPFGSSCGNGFEPEGRTEEQMRGQGWRQNFEGLVAGGRFGDGGWFCPSHAAEAVDSCSSDPKDVRIRLDVTVPPSPRDQRANEALEVLAKMRKMELRLDVPADVKLVAELVDEEDLDGLVEVSYTILGKKHLVACLPRELFERLASPRATCARCGFAWKDRPAAVIGATHEGCGGVFEDG